MFSVVIAAAALALAPSAPASPAPTPAPLREIVFKYSYDRKVERSVAEFGAPNLNVGTTNAYAGTITVDVMEVDSANMILVSVTDAARVTNGDKPIVGQVVVVPDGSLRIVGGDYDDTIETILPYMATNYFGDHPLQEGSEWIVLSPPSDKSQTTTKYTVSNVTADTATITSVTTAKGSDVAGTLSIETKVVYKASLLVPLSLDIVVIRSGSTSSSGDPSTQDATTHYHFDRVSDSRDSAGKG